MVQNATPISHLIGALKDSHLIALTELIGSKSSDLSGNVFIFYILKKSHLIIIVSVNSLSPKIRNSLAIRIGDRWRDVCSNAQIEPSHIISLAGSNDLKDLSTTLIDYMAQNATPLSLLIDALKDSDLMALVLEYDLKG